MDWDLGASRLSSETDGRWPPRGGGAGLLDGLVASILWPQTDNVLFEDTNVQLYHKFMDFINQHGCPHGLVCVMAMSLRQH